MDKVKARALTETAAIKAEVQSTNALVKKIDQRNRRPIESLKIEFKSLNRGMIEALHLKHWSEDIDSVITPVLELLGDRLKHIEINAVT